MGSYLNFIFTLWGNMILIKDRHLIFIVNDIESFDFGKYDTYKGLRVWCNMLLI